MSNIYIAYHFSIEPKNTNNSEEAKQLAEEGNDVNVYCLNENGELDIQLMRNPRITGYNQKIYKVNIEGGYYKRVNDIHKFRLADGTYNSAECFV